MSFTVIWFLIPPPQEAIVATGFFRLNFYDSNTGETSNIIFTEDISLYGSKESKFYFNDLYWLRNDEYFLSNNTKICLTSFSSHIDPCSRSWYIWMLRIRIRLIKFSMMRLRMLTMPNLIYFNAYADPWIPSYMYLSGSGIIMRIPPNLT